MSEIEFSADDCVTLQEFVTIYGGIVIPTDVERLYLQFATPDRATQFYTTDGEHRKLISTAGARKRSSLVSYTSLSDGKYIFVDRKRTKNPTTLAWDIIHLLGHMFQWNANRERASRLGLSIFGAAAREMAVKDFRHGTSKILIKNIQYELEANNIAYTILNHIFSEKKGKEFLSNMRKFIQNDVTFITDYYYRLLDDKLANSVEYDPDIGPKLREVGSSLKLLSLPDPAEWKLRAFDIICVPVLHKM